MKIRAGIPALDYSMNSLSDPPFIMAASRQVVINGIFSPVFFSVMTHCCNLFLDVITGDQSRVVGDAEKLCLLVPHCLSYTFNLHGFFNACLTHTAFSENLYLLSFGCNLFILVLRVTACNYQYRKESYENKSNRFHEI